MSKCQMEGRKRKQRYAEVRSLCQNASHLGLNLAIGVREQLKQSVVQLRGLVQHDPEEAVLLLPQ